jgi:ankyrin repeat protein
MAEEMTEEMLLKKYNQEFRLLLCCVALVEGYPKDYPDNVKFQKFVMKYIICDDTTGYECRQGNFPLWKLYKINKKMVNEILKEHIKFEVYNYYEMLPILDRENITFTDKKNNNVLLWACYERRDNIALDILNTFGKLCNPYQKNNNGHTAFYYASIHNMKDVTQKLHELTRKKKK